jgi:hypothetical protein
MSPWLAASLAGTALLGFLATSWGACPHTPHNPYQGIQTHR